MFHTLSGPTLENVINQCLNRGKQLVHKLIMWGRRSLPLWILRTYVEPRKVFHIGWFQWSGIFFAHQLEFVGGIVILIWTEIGGTYDNIWQHIMNKILPFSLPPLIGHHPVCSCKFGCYVHRIRQMKMIEYQSLVPNPSNKGSYLRQSVCTHACKMFWNSHPQYLKKISLFTNLLLCVMLAPLL